jgi:hypothetical protein
LKAFPIAENCWTSSRCLQNLADIKRLWLAAFAPIHHYELKEIPRCISNTPADFFQLTPQLETKSDFFSDDYLPSSLSKRKHALNGKPHTPMQGV